MLFINKRQKNAHFKDDALKQGALNNQMFRLGYCLPPYQNSWLRAWAILDSATMNHLHSSSCSTVTAQKHFI